MARGIKTSHLHHVSEHSTETVSSSSSLSSILVVIALIAIYFIVRYIVTIIKRMALIKAKREAKEHENIIAKINTLEAERLDVSFTQRMEVDKQINILKDTLDKQ